jgi:hypothetical protein
MTREHVMRAVKEGIPFMIKMADGEKYTVDDETKVAIGQTTVVVMDDHDLPHLLPLLTMTGLSYLRPTEPTM